MRVAVTRALAAAAIALAGTGLTTGLALHVLEPSLDPLHRMLSDYGDTPHRPVLEVAEIAIGASGILAAAALAVGAGATRATLVGTSMLVLAGATTLGLAIWPDGVMHLSMVWAGQGVTLVAMGAFAFGSRSRQTWRTFGVLSWALVALTALGIVGAEWLTPFPALIQRGYWVVLIAWVVAGAVAALRAVPSAENGSLSVRPAMASR
jgi:hypothetical protein